MAAPSVGRRSCAGQREAAVGRMGASKGLLGDGFFSLPSSGSYFNILCPKEVVTL